MIKENENIKFNNYREDEINVSKYFNQIFKNKKILLIGVFSATLILGSLLNRSKPIWQGGFQFLIQNSDSGNTSLNGNNFLSNILKVSQNNSIKNQLSVIKSPVVLLQVYKDINNTDELGNNFKDTKTFQDYERWLKSLNIETLENSNIVDVKYKNQSKEIIILTLEKVMKRFQDYSLENKEKDFVRTIKYLENEISKAKVKSDNATKELNNFSIKYRFGGLDGKFTENKNKAINNNEGISNNINFYAENKSSFKENSDNFNTEKSTRYTSLFSLLDRYELELATLKNKYKPTSKKIISKQREIEDLKKSLSRPNEILLEFRDLQRNAARNSVTLKSLEDNLAIINIDKERIREPWQIISYPVIYKQISPRIVYNYFLSFLYSSIIISISLLIKENKNGLVYDLDELKSLLTFEFICKLKKYNQRFNEIAIKDFLERNSIEIKRGIGFLILIDDLNPANFQKDFIGKKDNFKFYSMKEIELTLGNEYLFIICSSAFTKIKDIQEVNNYLGVFEKKVLGWYLLEENY